MKLFDCTVSFVIVTEMGFAPSVPDLYETVLTPPLVFFATYEYFDEDALFTTKVIVDDKSVAGGVSAVLPKYNNSPPVVALALLGALALRSIVITYEKSILYSVSAGTVIETLNATYPAP